jgi:hypothetical protein
LPGRALALASSAGVYLLRGRSSCGDPVRGCSPPEYRATAVGLRVGEPTVRRRMLRRGGVAVRLTFPRRRVLLPRGRRSPRLCGRWPTTCGIGSVTTSRSGCPRTLTCDSREPSMVLSLLAVAAAVAVGLAACGSTTTSTGPSSGSAMKAKAPCAIAYVDWLYLSEGVKCDEARSVANAIFTGDDGNERTSFMKEDFGQGRRGGVSAHARLGLLALQVQHEALELWRSGRQDVVRCNWLPAVRLRHVPARWRHREDDHGDGPAREPQGLLTTMALSPPAWSVA